MTGSFGSTCAVRLAALGGRKQRLNRAASKLPSIALRSARSGCSRVSVPSTFKSYSGIASALAASQGDLMGVGIEVVVPRDSMKRQRRRLLLASAGGIALLALDAPAQTTAKTYRIGWLEMTPPDLRAPSQTAFWRGIAAARLC